MPTATFVPEKALVQIRTTSADWDSPTDRVTIQRRLPSGNWQTIPGGENIPAVGSYCIAVDQEMPLDSQVTYRAVARGGVSSAWVQVDTHGAEWGLWMKSRRGVAHTQMLYWSGIGDISEDAQGNIYEIHGGKTIAQSYGVLSEQVEVTVWTEGWAAFNALRTTLKGDRRLFFQQPSPKELPDGWWFVERATFSNPDQRTLSSAHPIRFATLSMRRIEPPAGSLKGASGNSYTQQRVAYPTYSSAKTSGKKYWQLREP